MHNRIHGSSTEYISPEPALGLRKTLVRKRIRKWFNNKHKKKWENIHWSRLFRGKLNKYGYITDVSAAGIATEELNNSSRLMQM